MIRVQFCCIDSTLFRSSEVEDVAVEERVVGLCFRTCLQMTTNIGEGG